MVKNKTALFISLMIIGICVNTAKAQSHGGDRSAATTDTPEAISSIEAYDRFSPEGVAAPDAGDTAAPATATPDGSIAEHGAEADVLTGKKVWEFVKGRKAVDAILLGMWSLHFDATGSLFGDGRVNEVNNLVGLQLFGFNAGTFINSHDDRTYFLGLSRRVYTTHLWDDNVRLDIGYNAGLLYGYGDELYNLFGISVYVVPNLGFTYKGIGVDFGFVPVGVLTFGFRVDFDALYAIGQPR